MNSPDRSYLPGTDFSKRRTEIVYDKRRNYIVLGLPSSDTLEEFLNLQRRLVEVMERMCDILEASTDEEREVEED